MNKTTAYIDASNLKFGIKQSGWDLDYKSFRSWLRVGYDISFKPTITSKEGRTKGNVDGELILAIAKDFYENRLGSAVLVAGDGDYHCIVEFLKEKNIPIKIVSPNKKYLSLLLKRTNVPIIILDEFIEILRQKTKRPPNMP